MRYSLVLVVLAIVAILGFITVDAGFSSHLYNFRCSRELKNAIKNHKYVFVVYYAPWYVVFRLLIWMKKKKKKKNGF